MRTLPAVWRSSAMLSICFGLGACELAKRDFADTASSETPSDGGASGEQAVSTTRGETSGATGAEVTSGRESTEDEVVTGNAPSGDSSAHPSTTSPADSGGNSDVAPPGETTGPTIGTGPEPGDTSAAGQASSNDEQTTGSLCDQNILVDGSFEAGEEKWTPSSNYTAFEQRVHPLVVANDHESLANYAVTAHEGTQFAFLGDVPDNEYDKYHTTLTQSVFVPQEAIGLALVGHIWVSTNETEEQEWDIAYIQLESQENSEDYWQFKYWSNLDASDGWVKFDAYLDVVDAFRGKHVNLLVQALTDEGTPTRFWFDELEVVVVCP